MDMHSIIVTLAVFLLPCCLGWDNHDRVSLGDVSVLTLYHGKTTNSRRSPPIPQVKCIGGSAGCSSFTPRVVQCYNRGSDGYDVQWECKTDMDNAYRFGQVEISCEGYDYPDDPFVLRGSCGLEYTLDLTKEGQTQKNGGHHDYYGNSHNNHDYYQSSQKKKGNLFGDVIFLVIVGIVVYAVYKTCLSGGQDRGDSDGRRPDHRSGRPTPSAPPPPGFRDEYMPGSGCSSSFDSTYAGSSSYTAGPRNATGGGFWSGAATGGILGYLFGSRTNTGYGYNHHRPYGNTWGSNWGSGWGSSWGSGLGSNRWGSGGGGTTFRSTASTGTRTASGFGGTKRR